MIALVSTTCRVQLTASGTTDLDVHASYVDESGGTYTPGRKNTNITSTSATDVVASPASSTDRLVKTLHVRNAHADMVTVTIEHRDSASTTVELVKVALASGAALHYDEHRGWRVLDPRGRELRARVLGFVQSTGTDLDVVVLSSDDVNNNASANTAEDVAGLTLSYPDLSPETYWFRFVVQYTSASTNTGSRWMVNFNTLTSMIVRSDYSRTTTAQTVNEGIELFDAPSSANTNSASTGANIAVVEGFWTSAGAGPSSFWLRFASEVSSSAITAKAGSIAHWMQTL